MGRAVVVTPLLLLLLLLLSVAGASGKWRRWEEEEEEEWQTEPEETTGAGEARRSMFVLDNFEKVVDSEGGEVRVVRGFPWPPAAAADHRRAARYGWAPFGASRKDLMHIGFISMEPKTLFVPQYLDSNLILFVHRGEVKVGWIYKDELVERKLKRGDLLRIGAGSTFYMANIGKGQRLQIICSIDASESIGFEPYQAFFIGGGRSPRSVLAGFDPKTLATAFNVTYDDLESLLTAQTRGPIVYFTGEHGSRGEERGPRSQHELGEEAKCSEPWPWRVAGRGEEAGCGDAWSPWSWRKLLIRLVGGASNAQANAKDKPVRSTEPYNLYGHKPSFKNNYGWSIAVDEHAYEALKYSDIGVYLVELTAGSMMAPHVNPRATEYGIVLAGSGMIQAVFPNGSLAVSTEVNVGDVFWIPRYFPFCQIASRSGPLQFVGFTTSARRNRPQFLAGTSSVLRKMVRPEVAAGFGVNGTVLSDFVEAQKEAVIVPSWPEPRKERTEREEERGEERDPLLPKPMTKDGEPLLIKQMINA